MYYIGMQPRNCHGDYQILVDHEWVYLHLRSKLVLDPILSPIDMAAVKRQHATKFGL